MAAHRIGFGFFLYGKTRFWNLSVKISRNFFSAPHVFSSQQIDARPPKSFLEAQAVCFNLALLFTWKKQTKTSFGSLSFFGSVTSRPILENSLLSWGEWSPMAPLDSLQFQKKRNGTSRPSTNWTLPARWTRWIPSNKEKKNTHKDQKNDRERTLQDSLIVLPSFWKGLRHTVITYPSRDVCSVIAWDEGITSPCEIQGVAIKKQSIWDLANQSSPWPPAPSKVKNFLTLNKIF